LPLLRPRHHARGERGPRQLSRSLAEGPEGGQEGRVPRRQPRPAGRGVPAWPPARRVAGPGRPAMTVARFALGQLVITANASLLLPTEEVLTGLRRHACGDWGDLWPEDALANDAALREGGRLLSAYGQGATRFWVITEADRSVTTVLVPDDY